MPYRRWYSLVLAIILVSFFSCSQTFLPTEEECGTISIEMPPLAPWLGDKKTPALSEERQPENMDDSARAWMVASSVKFDLYSGSSIALSWTFNPASPGWGSGTGVGTSTKTGIPSGTYTKLVASIFNNNVSTSTPVVSGEVLSVTVNPGSTTTRTITCFPVSSVFIGTSGTYSSTYSLVTRAEKWFRVESPYSNTRFYVNSVSGDMDIYIFGPDGSLLGSQASSGTGESSVVLSTPSNPYYVVMFAYSGGSGKIKFSN